MKKRVLVKIGGKAFEDKKAYFALADSIRRLQHVDFILVHGGGAEISKALDEAGQKSEFIDGLRITTAAQIRIVEKVLSESVNARITDYLQNRGILCRRLSGKTDNLIQVDPLTRYGQSLGFVGKVKSINPIPVTDALQEGLVPVISPISADESGESYNVNADSAAAALSSHTGCSDLVYFTDVAGVLSDGSVISSLSIKQAEGLIRQGVIRDGMVAKMESAFEALSGNVKRVHICRWENGALESIVKEEIRFGTTVHL